MKRLWLAKIFIAVGVLLFIARPFYGFAMISKYNYPAPGNILVKIFSKRGTESKDDSGFGISDLDKKPPHTGPNLLHFIHGLQGYALAFGKLPDKVYALSINQGKFRLHSLVPAWLLNSQLII